MFFITYWTRLHDTVKRYATTSKTFETTQTGTPFDCIIFILLLDKRIAYLIQANENENFLKALDIRGFGESLILDAFLWSDSFSRNRSKSTHEILSTGANEKTTV